MRVSEDDLDEMGIVKNRKILNQNYFVLLLKPSEELYAERADLLNYKMYNNLRKYRQVYVYKKEEVNNDFEPFKSF